MQQQYSESLFEGDLSASIMSMAPEDDSQVISLFQGFQVQVQRQRQLIGVNVNDSKNRHEQDGSSCSLRFSGQKNRGYYSQCNEPRKRHTKVVNLHDKKTKKRRTRAYIEMLENRIDQLASQLEKLKKLYKMNKDYIKKISHSQQVINGYFVGKQQIYKKIEIFTEDLQQEKRVKKLGIPEPQPQTFSVNPIAPQESLSTKNKTIISDSSTFPSSESAFLSRNESKLMQEIRTLRIRQGVFGVDRTKAINYYFREMIQVLLPDVQKYLLLMAQSESDIFDSGYFEGKVPDYQEQWRTQMLGKMDLSRQLIAFIQSLKQPILEEKAKFDEILLTFYDAKCRLSEQGRKMESIFDHFIKKMAPLQVGLSLCYIEKYRFQKGFSTMESAKEVMGRLSKEEVGYNYLDPYDPVKI